MADKDKNESGQTPGEWVAPEAEPDHKALIEAAGGWVSGWVQTPNGGEYWSWKQSSP